MAKYVLGMDFGTLSARALVAEVGTGRELGTATMEYRHAVMDRQLPGGKILPPDFALQHPQDYIDCMKAIIPQAIAEAGIEKDDIIGLGLDFTSCTIVPVDENGTPLCLKPEWADEPHAYFKLWKHHGAQEEANCMTELALQRGERFLARYGGKVSSEWMLPKVWETLRRAPKVYEAAHSFMEAGDWIVFLLTGKRTHNCTMAGYKAMWHKREGYPCKEYLRALDPRLENVFEETPDMLLDIVARVNDPRFRICLDVGHINVYSRVPVLDWLEQCAEYVSHFHIHSNDGSLDSHNPPSEGSIPIKELLQRAYTLCPHATYTLELTQAQSAVVWLEDNGLL